MEAADEIKNKGNALFKAGELDQALLKYDKALRYLEAHPGIFCLYIRMYVCMPVDMHVYIHTHIHAYIHTYIRPYIHTYIHTYTGLQGDSVKASRLACHLNTYIHTFTHTYIHTQGYKGIA